ncbi:MAG TPA: class I SAM-dependent methyltransferase [Rhizomicrobium sp.]|jgi:methyltransferase (TIGR00027 family)
MPEQQRGASRTALGVAAIRAAHQRIDGEPKLLEDRISEKLVDRETLERTIARAAAPEALALRVRVLLRSRFAEERLEAAVRRGVRQFVCLGAGFDTFAYRQPDWAHSLRLYEVDHAASQSAKRAHLAEAGIAPPPNLEYVAIDFESVSLRDGLKASSLDFAQPAFFSCLGVFVYLSRAAVDEIFALVADFPLGSEIAFTFASGQALESETARRVDAAGEPWRTFLDPAELSRDLERLGYAPLELLDLAETGRRFFNGRTDLLQLPPRTGIGAAIVRPRHEVHLQP